MGRTSAIILFCIIEMLCICVCVWQKAHRACCGSQMQSYCACVNHHNRQLVHSGCMYRINLGLQLILYKGGRWGDEKHRCGIVSLE
mmetsp:Transcript_57318/g.94256  ORF Transcript_57318/g.94256 Transcript_57318/m.94256 type:complete len:86 (+) Transcript_57318:361-618(+)